MYKNKQKQALTETSQAQHKFSIAKVSSINLSKLAQSERSLAQLKPQLVFDILALILI